MSISERVVESVKATRSNAIVKALQRLNNHQENTIQPQTKVFV